MSTAPPKNSQQAIERLLTTSTCTGPYATGGAFSTSHSLPVIRITGDAQPLSLPLTDTDIQRIIDHRDRAGVGLPDKTVVNLEVRKTWQLTPGKLSISNFDGTLEYAIDQVSKGLGTSTDYNVSAQLYKLLLYEKDCFFDRHRDNERLDGMFGTLIIELPSIYQGAELSIWSPLTPSEKKDYGGQGDGSKMHYTAFYADCYHQVSKLTSGHRVALVYHLTAQPKVPKVLQHIPDPPLLPAQPAEARVVQDIADRMYVFANLETNEDYLEPPSPRGVSAEKREGTKPSKFAIVLSHHYTPAGLSAAGLDALKGSDRSIGELIWAGAWCRPSQMEPSDHQEDGAPYYDAALCLAVLWDLADGSPGTFPDEDFDPDPWGLGLAVGADAEDNSIGPHGFRTTGQLIPLAGTNVPVPLNMGPPIGGDLNPEYDPSWFQDNSHKAFYAANTWPDRYGNHSLPIFGNELLFASEGAKEEYGGYGCDNVLADPKQVEFLGNGMPAPGRCYSRSIILMWPKEHREAIELQSKGGSALKEKKTAGDKKPRVNKKQRSY